jgi:4-amino-4-deoxy-L-arabinose transferase-like glycosyltransferase
MNVDQASNIKPTIKHEHNHFRPQIPGHTGFQHQAHNFDGPWAGAPLSGGASNGMLYAWWFMAVVEFFLSPPILSLILEIHAIPATIKKKKSSRFFMLIIVLIPLIIFSFKPNQVYTK